MSFYDTFKEVLNLAQKADNIELYRKLLDVSKDALELQSEVYKLTEENRSLKAQLNEKRDANIIEADLELTQQGYYIRKSEREAGKNTMYCAACWQNMKKLMPYTKSIGRMFQCSNCHSVIQ